MKLPLLIKSRNVEMTGEKAQPCNYSANSVLFLSLVMMYFIDSMPCCLKGTSHNPSRKLHFLLITIFLFFIIASVSLSKIAMYALSHNCLIDSNDSLFSCGYTNTLVELSERIGKML